MASPFDPVLRSLSMAVAFLVSAAVFSLLPSDVQNPRSGSIKMVEAQRDRESRLPQDINVLRSRLFFFLVSGIYYDNSPCCGHEKNIPRFLLIMQQSKFMYEFDAI